MTKYYFAARYSRNAEMRRYRDELETLVPDAKVTSVWIDQHGGTLLDSVAAKALNTDPASVVHYAQTDLDNLKESDVVVSFTGQGGEGKGGRHVEFGMALAAGRYLVIIGPRENVFHTFDWIRVYPTWQAFLSSLLDAEHTR